MEQGLHSTKKWSGAAMFWQCGTGGEGGKRFLRRCSRRLDPRQAVCSLFWIAGGAESSGAARSQIGPARSGGVGQGGTYADGTPAHRRVWLSQWLSLAELGVGGRLRLGALTQHVPRPSRLCPLMVDEPPKLASAPRLPPFLVK